MHALWPFSQNTDEIVLNKQDNFRVPRFSETQESSSFTFCFDVIVNYSASQLYVGSMPHLDVSGVPVHPRKQILPGEKAAALGCAVPAELHVSACVSCVHKLQGCLLFVAALVKSGVAMCYVQTCASIGSQLVSSPGNRGAHAVVP